MDCWRTFPAVQTPTTSATADYDVFGALRGGAGSGTFGFTGEQYDAETGYTYLRARYYDPALGRFVSADSVQPNAPGTQGWNLYAYVANNATTWTDPSGNTVNPAVLAPYALVSGCVRTMWCATLLAQGNALVVSGPGIQRPSGIAIMAAALIGCALDIWVGKLSDGSPGIVGGCYLLYKGALKTLEDHAPTCASPEACESPSPNPERKKEPFIPKTPSPTDNSNGDECEALKQGLPLILTEDRKNHIREDHSTGARYQKGEFYLDFSAFDEWDALFAEILGRAASGTRDWEWNIEHQSCNLELRMGRVIGRASNGQPTSVVLLSADPVSGNVITMYPVRFGLRR